MNEKINILVQEILTLAPELKEKESEVRRLVELLLESKPDVKIDEHFVMELRTQLRNEVLSSQPKNSEKEGNKVSIMNIINNRFAYALVLIVFSVIAVSPFLNFGGQDSDSVMKLAFEPSITDVKANGFGELTSQQGVEETEMTANDRFAMMEASQVDNVSGGAMEMTTEEMYVADGMGGFSGESVPSAMPISEVGAVVDSNDGRGVVDEKMMVMPPWEIQYPKYIFRGDLPDIPENGNVYRRSLKAFNSAGFVQLIEGFNLGLIDIGTFENVQIQRFEVISEGDSSYTISVDFDRGSLSIYRSRTKGDVYMQQKGVDINNINENEVIQVADSFFKKHNIDVSSYGEPEIDIPEHMTYAGISEKDIDIMPGSFAPVYSVQVRYPLMIEGIKVVGSSGYSVGINVSVNINGNYVENVWGLETLAFERSSYPFITDKDTIIGLVEQGGYNSVYRRGEDGNVVEVEVSDPKMVLMKYWKYDESGYGNPDELFVPALLFEVDNTAAQKSRMYINDRIVVPLVEGIIQQYDRPVPMPLMETTDSPASGGSMEFGEVIEAQVISTDE